MRVYLSGIFMLHRDISFFADCRRAVLRLASTQVVCWNLSGCIFAKLPPMEHIMLHRRAG